MHPMPMVFWVFLGSFRFAKINAANLQLADAFLSFSFSLAALVIVSCKFLAAFSPHDLFLLLVQVGTDGGCPNLWVCTFDDHASASLILPAGFVASLFAFYF